MAEYASTFFYVNEVQDIAEKIIRIDLVISALLNTALLAAGTGNITEYSLDDGQTKIREAYRSAGDITNSILAYQRMRQAYINQLQGHVVRLVDSKNFI